jgi:hypothetical protein
MLQELHDFTKNRGRHYREQIRYVANKAIKRALP